LTFPDIIEFLFRIKFLQVEYINCESEIVVETYIFKALCVESD